MKRQSFTNLLLTLFLAATVACSLIEPSAAPKVSPTVPTLTGSQPTATAATSQFTVTTVAVLQPTATTAVVSPTVAAPSIPFPDPAGLDSLDSYSMTLRITFKGTRDGQAVETKDIYTRAFWREPQAQFTTIETTDEEGAPIQLLVGAVGEIRYLRRGLDQPCTVQQEETSTESRPFNPAIMLWPLWYGQDMGQETVNGVAARRYVVDANSLGQGVSEVGGDVWIAEQGAFVVKYELRFKADEVIFGKGVMGERTVAYELNDVGAQKEMTLPAGCPPPVSDLPAMADAANLVRGPLGLSYTTTSKIEDVVSFYQKEMKALGWVVEVDDNPALKDRWLVFALAEEKEHAYINLRPEGDQVQVEAQVIQD